MASPILSKAYGGGFFDLPWYVLDQRHDNHIMIASMDCQCKWLDVSHMQQQITDTLLEQVGFL